MATKPTALQPPRVIARNAVHRFLGNPTGQAQQMVADLTDGEVTEVNAAAADKRTARAEIKRIFARAHERRGESAAFEARQRQTRLRRVGLARKVLERELQLHVAESVALAGFLQEHELEALASLEHAHDGGGKCKAILQTVFGRFNEQPDCTTKTNFFALARSIEDRLAHEAIAAAGDEAERIAAERAIDKHAEQLQRDITASIQAVVDGTHDNATEFAPIIPRPAVAEAATDVDPEEPTAIEAVPEQPAANDDETAAE